MPLCLPFASRRAVLATALFLGGVPSLVAQTPPPVTLTGVSETAGPATPPPLPANPSAAPSPDSTSAPGDGSSAGESLDPDGQAVLHFELSEDTPIAFPTAVNRTTTLLFPAPIEDLHGAGITSDPSKAKGDFLATATPGATYLSISPLRDGVRRNFNVIVAGKVYAFEAYPAFPRKNAAYTVILDDPTGAVAQGRNAAPAVTVANNPLFPGSGAIPMALPVQPVRSLLPPRPAYEAAGSARLLGTMDSTRLLAGLNPASAAQVAAVMPRTTLVPRPAGDVTDHGDYSVQLTHVVRFDRFDALGFAVTVTNKTDHRIVFDPESFTVRAGDPRTGPLYYAVVADLAPDFAAKESKRAFFVLIGDSTGEPNRLDPGNPFSVSLDRLDLQAASGRTAASTRRSQALRHVLQVSDGKTVVDPTSRAYATPAPRR